MNAPKIKFGPFSDKNITKHIYIYVDIEYGLQAKPSILYRAFLFSPQPRIIQIISIAGVIIII